MAKATAAPYVRLRTGLVEPHHVAAMGGGSPFVLYIWLHTRVRFSGAGAGTTFPDAPYHHDDAALALGAPRTSVRRWFSTLMTGGYITTQRGRYGLAVTITKYEPECPPVDTPQPARVSTSGAESVHGWPSECPPMDTRVSKREHSTTNKVARGPNDTSDTRDSKGGNAAPTAPPALVPAVRGNPNVQAAIDALRGEGMTGVLTPRDRAALKTTTADIGEMARLYAAIFRGEYGDPFMHDNLSVVLCLEKLPGWQSHQEGHRAPAKENGRYSRAAANAEAIENFGKVLDDAGYHGRPAESLPPLRPQLRGLPS